MSKYSTIYDALVTSLGTLFPSKTIIPLPESLEDNDDNQLKDSYGIVCGGVDMPEQVICSTDRFDHSFTIVITRLVYRTDHDITIWQTAKKSLKEDQISVMQLLVTNNQIGQESNIEIITVDNGSEIQSVTNDKKTIIKCEISFIIGLSESR